jgi:hypothetical protein
MVDVRAEDVDALAELIAEESTEDAEYMWVFGVTKNPSVSNFMEPYLVLSGHRQMAHYILRNELEVVEIGVCNITMRLSAERHYRARYTAKDGTIVGGPVRAKTKSWLDDVLADEDEVF